MTVIKPMKNKVVISILNTFQRSSKFIIKLNSNFKNSNEVKITSLRAIERHAHHNMCTKLVGKLSS